MQDDTGLVLVWQCTTPGLASFNMQLLGLEEDLILFALKRKWVAFIDATGMIYCIRDKA